MNLAQNVCRDDFYRDENFPLFRGFPLFSLKFAEIKMIRLAPICQNLISFEWGYGVSSFLYGFPLFY